MMEHEASPMGPPPPELEERVVAALRRGGLLAQEAPVLPMRRGAGLRRWALPLAALFAGAVVGWALGPGSIRPSTPPVEKAESAASVDEQPLFVLMFSGGPQEGEELVRLIHANGEWARTTLARHFTGGQRLLPRGEVLVAELAPTPTAPRSDDFTPTGFFLIRARDLDEAVALGRTSPHLALGGHLTVWQVDDLRWLPQNGAARGPRNVNPRALSSHRGG